MGKFSEIIAQDKPVLVDFFAEWCGPCKAMAPMLKQVKENLGDDITILKVDVDKNRSLASAYNIQGVPTLVLFKSKQVLWKHSGVVPKSDIISKIKQYSL